MKKYRHLSLILFWVVIFILFLVSACFLRIYFLKQAIFQQQVEVQLDKQQQILTMLQKKEEKQSNFFEKLQTSLDRAHFELVFLYNPVAAESVLKRSEAIIDAVQDLRLVPLKKTIHQVRMALQALPVMDRNAVFLDIEKIMDDINTLPILPAQETGLPVVSEARHPTVAKQFFIAMMDTLKRSVIIRHADSPLPPLLLPTQHAYLLFNLRLQLQQASWAVLHQEPVIYQAAISKTIAWIKSYYPEDAEQVRAVLRRLNALETIDLKPPLPDLTPALRQLDELSA